MVGIISLFITVLINIHFLFQLNYFYLYHFRVSTYGNTWFSLPACCDKNEEYINSQCVQCTSGKFKLNTGNADSCVIFTASTLKIAVDEWCTNEVLANKKYNGDINTWDTSEVISMDSLFKYKRNFNHDISKWDTSKVINMFGMFYDAKNFNGNISTWNTAKVEDMRYIFLQLQSLISIYHNGIHHM